MKLIVDYYRPEEMCGNVQSILGQIRQLDPDGSRMVSLRDAERALAFEVPRPQGSLTRALPALIRDACIELIKGARRRSRAAILFEEFARRITQLQEMYFQNLASLAIDSYLKAYEELFGPQLIIRNSQVGNLVPLRSRQICFICDNNISGPELLFRRGYFDFRDFFKYRYGYTSLQLLSARNASACVVPSADAAKEMQTYGVDAHVIHHGIDTDFFRPLDRQELKRSYGLSGRTVACWVGSTHPIDGLYYMLRLARDFPEVSFVLVFKDNPPIRGERNLRVLRSYDAEKLREIYNIADFYVSTCIYETFGLCAMEAAACNTPLVSLRTGALSDIDTHEIGCVVDDWSIGEYRQAIKAMLSHHDSFNPRHTVESEFNLRQWRTEWRRLISSVEHAG